MDDLGKLLVEIEQEILRTKYGNQSSETNQRTISFLPLFKALKPEDLKHFHTECDSKGPTLTVLRGKYNTWFGGYTSCHWSAGNKDTKRDDEAFVFYKTDNKFENCHFFKIREKMKSKAVTCDERFGPTFGVGKKYDLQTFDLTKDEQSEMKDGYLRLNGKMKFGTAYKCEGHQYSKSDINSGKLDIKQMEIYQVVFQDLKESWREKPKDFDTMKDELANWEPLAGLNLRFYNILLVGTIKAGKSSFCNTLASVFAEEIITPAVVGADESSVTNKITKYNLKSKKEGKRLCVNIIDIRGCEANRTYEHELAHLLDGRLPENYSFPEHCEEELNEEQLAKSTTLGDEVHLVCFVVDANNISALEEAENLMRALQMTSPIIRKKGIPIVAIGTKFDLLCPRVNKDAANTYSSPAARAAVESIAQALGLQSKDVFPIVNYVNDNDLLSGKSGLAIHALRSMIKVAEDNLAGARRPDELYEIKQFSLQEKAGIDPLIERIQSDIEQLKDKHLRLLCVGVVNSGKSSLIDSMMSSLTRNIYTNAGGGTTRDEGVKESNTEMFQCHTVPFKNATGVTFGDMPGFTANVGDILGLIQMVIDGHVPNKCQISNGFSCDHEAYRKNPLQTDQFNGVCIVVNIASVETLSKENRSVKIHKDLMRLLQTKGIPFVVVLTKCDNLEPTLTENTVEIYSREKINKSKNKLMKILQIKENIVFPVVNYVHQKRVCQGMDILLLNTLLGVVNLVMKTLVGSDDSTEGATGGERKGFDYSKSSAEN